MFVFDVTNLLMLNLKSGFKLIAVTSSQSWNYKTGEHTEKVCVDWMWFKLWLMKKKHEVTSANKHRLRVAG